MNISLLVKLFVEKPKEIKIEEKKVREEWTLQADDDDRDHKRVEFFDSHLHDFAIDIFPKKLPWIKKEPKKYVAPPTAEITLTEEEK